MKEMIHKMDLVKHWGLQVRELASETERHVQIRNENEMAHLHDLEVELGKEKEKRELKLEVIASLYDLEERTKAKNRRQMTHIRNDHRQLRRLMEEKQRIYDDLWQRSHNVRVGIGEGMGVGVGCICPRAFMRAALTCARLIQTRRMMDYSFLLSPMDVSVYHSIA